MTAITELIERRHHEILGLWTEAMRKFPLSDDLSPIELSDVMPAFLASLGRGDDGSCQLRAEQLELIERHLSSRIRHGFVLNEVLTEFAALGRCVSKVLADLPEAERPSAPEVAQLFGELHLTAIAAAAIFNEHMLEDEQTEKRYRQRLQHIASLALRLPRASTGASRTELYEILGVVMAAVGAHTAALVLYDGEQRRLLRSLTIGLEHVALQDHLEEHISGTGDTDASVHGAALSEALGARGMCALVGVPLALEPPWLGAVYVARSEGPRFSASERRRLDALTDTVALYIESSQRRRDRDAEVARFDDEGRSRERQEAVLMHEVDGPLAAALAQLRHLAESGREPPSGSLGTILVQLGHVQELLRAAIDAQTNRAESVSRVVT